MQSEAGTETTGLAQLMGHSTTQTLQRYVHNSFEHHQKAVAGLEDRVMGFINGAELSHAKGRKEVASSSRSRKPLDAPKDGNRAEI